MPRNALRAFAPLVMTGTGKETTGAATEALTPPQMLTSGNEEDGTGGAVLHIHGCPGNSVPYLNDDCDTIQ